jgi:hypothetical protein
MLERHIENPIDFAPEMERAGGPQG